METGDAAILSAIEKLNRPMVSIAIDGRCAAGKTTAALRLQKFCGCNVIHMDHFFLPMARRTAERMAEPGGHIDHERFLEEVLLPLGEGNAVSYRPFDCRRQEPAEPVRMESNPVTIIEGAYSCHPLFVSRYDLTVFMTVSPEEQMRRIRRRNGAGEAVRFQNEWIPREERYFADCGIRNLCSLCIQTDRFDRGRAECNANDWHIYTDQAEC